MATAFPFFFSTGGVAAHTIAEVTNALFAMFGGDLRFVVLVAAVTGVALQGGGVAGLASINAALAMIDGEGMRLVELRREPGINRMTGCAVIGEQPGMDVRFLVAAGTQQRRTLVLPIDVALLTGYSPMSPFKFENGFRVIKAGFCPVFRGVA